MKQLFFEYYPFDEKDIKKIWNECLFSYDTNVLLNSYRYTDKTRDKFYEILDKIKDRSFLTHHTAYEFHKNRITTISGQLNAYDNLSKFLDETNNQITSELNKYKKHTYIQSENINNRLSKIIKNIKNEISLLKTKHPDLLKDDPIRDKITLLFSERITKEFDEIKLNDIYKLGKIRYEKKIPPGYEDLKEKKESSENSLYGDLIIWNQLIDHSKEQSKPIVFVTEDLKEDWWYKFSGKTLGARPELLKEFKAKTGQNILIYNADSFLNYSGEYTGVTIDKKIVKEVEDLREKDENTSFKSAYYDYLEKLILLGRKNNEIINNNRSLTISEIFDEKYKTMLNDQYLNSKVNEKISKSRANDNFISDFEKEEYFKRNDQKTIISSLEQLKKEIMRLNNNSEE